MWLRKWVWPVLAIVVFLLEMWAVLNGVPGDTISEWITDFPFLLWLPAIILFTWLPIHLWQNRRNRDNDDDTEV